MTERVIPFSTAALAYRAAQPVQVRPAAQARPVVRRQALDTLDLSAGARRLSQPAHPLAAARVSGPVAFDGAAPAAAKGALPIYAHPADRNAAATGISAGRLIDTRA